MGTLGDKNRHVMRTLREREGLVGVVSLGFALGALAATILLRNFYILAFWAVTMALVFIWSVLTRTNEELRHDFAEYEGPFGLPVAVAASKLPGVGAKVLLILLVVGAFAAVLLVGHGAPSSVAMANAECARAFAEYATEDPSLYGYTPFGEATQAIQRLKPPSGSAQTWPAFVAGLVVHVKILTANEHGIYISDGVRARLERTIREGEAAAAKLGVRCTLPHV